MRIVLLALIASSALANWSSRLPGERTWAARVELVSKPLTTALVIVLAASSGAPGAQVATATIALAFCLAGDVALMEPIDNFVLGLAAFLCGHVAFIVLFVELGLDHAGLALIAAVIGVAVAGVVGRPILLGARQQQRALAVPVAVYLVAILAMAVLGWWTGRGWVVLGSAAFVLSDSLLGREAFVPTPDGGAPARRLLPLAVMVTYHLAIVALALSL